MHLVSVGAESLRGRFTRQAHDVGVGSAGGDNGTCVRGILCSSARTRSVKTGSSERFACSALVVVLDQVLLAVVSSVLFQLLSLAVVPRDTTTLRRRCLFAE
jgi:hypothetical protein